MYSSKSFYSKITIFCLTFLLGIINTIHAQVVIDRQKIQLNSPAVNAKFSPDGQFILVAQYDGHLKLIDLSSKEIIKTFINRTEITGLEFSPSGKYFVTGTDDNTVKVWNVKTGRAIAEKLDDTGGASLTSMDIGSDKNLLATALSNGKIILWKLNPDPKKISETKFSAGEITDVAFDEHGEKVFATGGYNQILIWDPNTDKKDNITNYYEGNGPIVDTREGHALIGGRKGSVIKYYGNELEVISEELHNGLISTIDIDSNINLGISGSTDKTMELWDLSSGGVWEAVSFSNSVQSVDISKDGRYVVATISGSEELHIFELNSVLQLLGKISTVEKLNNDLNSKKSEYIDQRLEENQEIKKLTQEKGEFESTSSYKERLEEAEQKRKQLKIQYSNQYNTQFNNRLSKLRNDIKSLINTTYTIPIDIGSFNADNSKLTVEIPVINRSIRVTIPNNEARQVVPILREKESVTAIAKFDLMGKSERNPKINIRDYTLSSEVPQPHTYLRLDGLVLQTDIKNYWYGDKFDLNERKSVSAPPALTVGKPSFSDSDGDNQLSAGESAIVEFNISNSGQGSAQGVRVRGETEAQISGLSANIGTINANEERTVSLTLRGNKDIKDGKAEITLNINEAAGFDASPVNLTIPTRGYRPPSLQLLDVAIDDQSGNGNGEIEPGEVIDVTVRIANNGEGVAEGVNVTTRAGNNVFINSREEGSKQFNLGTIQPGSYKDITLKAFCNTEAEGFPISLDISESTREYGAQVSDLGLQLNRKIQGTQNLIVEASNAQKKKSKISSLAIDIENNIPETSAPKPNAIAVVIGNRSYEGDTPDVTYATRDASTMKDYLIKTFGYSPGNILYAEDASKAKMEVLLGDENNPGKLFNYVKPGKSEVFIYYSGHGAPNPNTNKAYLMPVDSDPSSLSITGYPLELLYQKLSDLQAKSVQVVIDACFSGATGGGGMLVDKASPIGINVKNPVAKLADGVVLTASSGSQIASWYPEKKHGLFTYFYLKGLQGAADADGNRNITVQEMNQYLTDTTDGVPYWARRLYNREQVPSIYSKNINRMIVSY